MSRVLIINNLNERGESINALHFRWSAPSDIALDELICFTKSIKNYYKNPLYKNSKDAFNLASYGAASGISADDLASIKAFESMSGENAEVEIRSNMQSICETIDWVAKSGEKVILLPINTRHEIASKGDKIVAASLISMTLHRRIAYTRCVSQKLSCNEVTVMTDDEKGFAQVNVKSIIDPADKLTEIINNAYAIERERLVIDSILKDNKSKNPTIRFVQDAYKKLDETYVPFKNGTTWRILYNIMHPVLHVKVTESQLKEIAEKNSSRRTRNPKLRITKLLAERTGALLEPPSYKKFKKRRIR